MDCSKKKQAQLIVTDGIDGGRRWRFLLVFAVCLAVFLTMADAQLCHADDPGQERTILAKGSDTNVPYSFLNEDGEVDGFNNELFRAVAEAAGLKAEIHLAPWPIVRQELEAGEIDVTTGMYYSKERDKLVDYSVPFVTVKHSIFVREDSQIKSLEDLGGKEVIVMRGAITHDFLIQEGIAQEIVLTEDTPAALRVLATGQHDAAVLIRLQGLYFLRESKIGNVKPVAEPFSPMKFCFAVREGDSELLFRLNEGLLVIKESGKYDEIYDKWFGALEEEAVSFSQVLRYIVLISLPLLVMLLAVASWSLRRQVRIRTQELNAELAERKWAEEAQRESEERYRGLFERVPVGLYRTTPDGQILDVNPALLEMMGFPGQETALGVNAPSGYVNAEDHARWQALMDREGVVRGFEAEWRRRDGTIIWVEDTARAVRDGEGRVLYYEGSLEDVTERKRAEEEIERLAKFPSENPNPVLRVAQDGTTLYANEASLPLLSVWGCQVNQPLPDDWREFTLDVLSSGASEETEVEVEDRILSLTFAPVVDADYVNVYGHDVTERARAEEELRESEEHSRRVILSIGDYVYVTEVARDGDFINRYLSPHIEALTGYPVEKFMADRHFWTSVVTHPDDRTATTTNAERLIRGQKTEIEYRMVRADGDVIWVRDSAKPYRLDDGSIIIYGVVSDITERKRAEAALRESEERFRTIVEMAPSLLQIIDARGNNIYISPNCEEITGYTQDELQSEPRWWVHEDGTPRAKEVFERAFREGVGGKDHEYKAVKKNGELWYASSSWESFRDKEGKFQGIVLQTIDITERKRAEKALRESQARFKDLYENAPIAYFSFGLDGLIHRCNRRTGELLGYAVEELLDRSVFELYANTPLGKEKASKVFQRFMAGETITDEELQMQKADGKPVWISLTVNAVRDSRGQIVESRSMVVDITERKRAEEALRDSEERVRHLSEATFEAIAIHEGGVVISANDQYFEMFGYEPDELLQKQAFPLTVAPEARDLMREQIATGGVGLYESIGLRKDGTKFPMEIRAREMEYQGRKVRVEAIMDIAERKRAEETRAHGQRTLLALSQAAQAVQRARTPEEVYQTVGDEVTKLGYHVVILTLRAEPQDEALTKDREHLSIAYMTFRPALLRTLENLTGLSAQTFQLPLAQAPVFRRVLTEGESSFDEPVAELMSGGLPGPLRPLAGWIAAMLELEQCITAPLTVGDETMELLHVTGSGLTEADVPAVTTFANQAAIALENARLFEDVQAGRERLRQLTQQIVSAQEEERRRLSRELHDETGQALTALRVSLDLIRADLPAEAALLRRRLGQAAALAGTTLEQIRLLAQDLRPPALDAVGLNYTLEGLCRDFVERTQLSIDYAGAELPALSEATDICLYRFLQEALTNVVKHAQANQVRVALRGDAETVSLSVEDDGEGFEIQARMRGGIGLVGLGERLEVLGGQLKIESRPGQGTRLTAHVPLGKAYLERRQRAGDSRNPR